MSISNGHLDSLVGKTYPSAEFEALAVESATLSYGAGGSPAGFTSVTATITGGPAPGTTSDETFQVAAVNDSTNSVTFNFVYDGSIISSQTEYVIGFANNSMLLSLDTPSELALAAYYNGASAMNGTIGALSSSPLTAGSSETYTQTAIDTGAVAPNNFSADGQSDVLVQNSNGDIVIEAIGSGGLSIVGAVNVGNPGPSWHVMGSADFNGDGQPDLLLQNTSGQIVDYLMSGTSIASGNYLGNPGEGWHVRGTGNFSGSGDASILLQNDNGSMVIWNTNGASVTSETYIGDPGAGWTVEGVADFNGDGKPDILVQNTNGALVVYTMNGESIASGAYLGNPGAGWSVSGTGEYSGNGDADILLHNDNGTDVIWDTNGSSVTGATDVGNPGASYSDNVAGLDLNGDGNSDLVVENPSTGTLVGYTLSNTATITAGAVLGSPGVGWNAIGDNPVQFIDGTGSNANLTATAGADQFDLTSFTAGLHTISGFDPAIDSVALSAATFGTYSGLQANEVAYQGGTFINLTPGTTGAAVVIEGIAPSQLNSTNFVFR